MMPSIALTSLLVLLGLTTHTLGQECGGKQSTMVYDKALPGIKYYSQCSFSTHTLNTSCILSSCPLLRGVCPLNSTSALNKTVDIINQCLGQSGLVCGINMSHIEKVPVSFTTAQLVPSSVANGTVHLNNGTSISNLERTQFQVVSSFGPITLSISATNIITTGSLYGTFALAAGSFLQPLLNAIPSSSLFNINYIAGMSTLNVSSTVSLDLTTHPPTINILDDHSNINLNFKNFTAPSGFSLPQDIVDPFNRAMNSFFKESVVYTVITNFLSTFAALALQAAQEGCL